MKILETYRKGRNIQKDNLKRLQKEANNARLAVDSCNCFSISIRGDSQHVYDILRPARIDKEFASLLRIIMPLPLGEHSTRQYMRPLGYLSAGSRHTDWMADYVVSNKDGNGVDP